MQLSLNLFPQHATNALTAFVLHQPGKCLLDKRKTPRGSLDRVLTDHEVELVRQVYEMGGISVRALAEKMEVSRSHIGDIITYRRRAYSADVQACLPENLGKGESDESPFSCIYSGANGSRIIFDRSGCK